MTAFDQAWDLAKMPIVPGSVYRDYRKEREREEGLKSSSRSWKATTPQPKLYSGKFDDPETGEQLDMEGVFHRNFAGKSKGLDVSIKGPDEKDRSYANFSISPILDRYDQSVNLESHGTETVDEFQRRGYATALYHLAAYLADRQRPRMEILPSDEQSSDAKAFWASQLDNLAIYASYGEEPRNWPVRGDLG